MHKKFLLALMVLFSLPSFLFAQIGESSDTFDDGKLDSTWSGSPHTYEHGEPSTPYYHNLAALDTADNEYLASNELKVEVHNPDGPPAVSVTDVNREEVGRYEKFEARLSLDNVQFTNPYNPEDINVHAWFKSPEGDTTWINGFYDDYQGADQWRVRFSPDVTGQWEYKVYVQDDSREGESKTRTFTAVDSEHKGWIKTSHNNPHYFMYDDSSSFYGTAVYSPWGNTQERFETFAEHGANLMGLWNINYGGFVNQHGMFEDELGRYDQTKAGKLDSLLSILEQNDIKLMYCFWPHDLFSKTVWATQWHNNPYNQLIDVEEVYSDSLVWEYQKKKYRYLIARYAHSRSLGIWEIINEMNGTDGWQNGRTEEAINWVGKVHQYFKEHDPYDHPTTANFSGGYDEYRPPLYELNDVPNIHIYESQGWPKQYSDDDLRSSYYNYGWASRRFWNNFKKPAIFGEAGASHTYIDPESSDYSLLFHNAIWTSLANGLATTPVWWSYPRLTSRDWDHLQYLGDFTSQIDFAHTGYDIGRIWANGADAYSMAADTLAFGWLRSHTASDVSGTELGIGDLRDGSYILHWYNTWSGDTVSVDTLVSASGLLKANVPQLSQARKDIAYSLEAIENASDATRLNLFINSADIQAHSDSNYSVVAYISDKQGRLATDAGHQISFRLTGPGELEEKTASAQNGIAVVRYHPAEGSTKEISITAEAEGLNSVTLNQKFASAIDSNDHPDQHGQYGLMDNNPNPFNPSPNIVYRLPESDNVSLEVFDMTGAKTTTLVGKSQ